MMYNTACNGSVSKRKELTMTGSLQTKNGKYYAVINLTDINGKRKQKWISTGYEIKRNKKNAEKFLREKLKEFELQENLIPTDILFSDYVLHWLSLIEKKVDTITYQGYKSVANAHIIPYFKEKGVKLSNIKRNDIQEYIDIKSACGRLDGKGGLSPKTIKTHRLIIQLVCKEAEKNDLILKSPCEFVVLPKQQRREADFYSIEELKQMFSELKNEQLYPLLYFTVMYGLRRSEVLGLKWDSINFDNNIITIKHTVVRYTTIVEKDSTKNASSHRSYPITPDVKNILLKLKEQEKENRRLFGGEYVENDYIFKWQDGKPFAPDYVSMKFNKLLKQHGLRHIRFHDLRHSCASLLVANGFMLKDIQEWLGHSDIQVTANIYAHLDAKRKTNIANSMSNSFTF